MAMARLTRVVVPQIPYHITHRGNRRARPSALPGHAWNDPASVRRYKNTIRKTACAMCLAVFTATGYCEEVTPRALADAKLALIGIAAYYYEMDNGSAPESFRALTYPRDYLLPLASNVYSTIWLDPFSSSSQPLLIQVELRQDRYAFRMPYPSQWRIVSRGPDGVSNPCIPESLSDDVVLTASQIEQRIHSDQLVPWARMHWQKLARAEFSNSDELLRHLVQMPREKGDFYTELGAAISGRAVGNFTLSLDEISTSAKTTTGSYEN